MRTSRLVLSLMFGFLVLGLASPVYAQEAAGAAERGECQREARGDNRPLRNRACGGAFVKLQTENLSNPRQGPLYVLMRASHPPIAARVAMCNDYRPWAVGGALRYEERMTP